MDKDKAKKIIKGTAIALGATYVVLDIIAKKQKADTTYKNEPDQQNPMQGKSVEFVADSNDPENADGECGHLEATGESNALTRHQSAYERYVKRGLDKALSFGGLVLLSPLMGGIALAIKIEDPGPVLFTQKRVGQDKAYFKLHKFRSMKMSTPHDVPTHMLENPESYITKVGGFLRKHSLDELPQIWDIFVGNMSVIGPRPALWNQDVLVAERDKVGANDVKPGLTGWAQINGRDELSLSDKSALDGVYTRELEKGGLSAAKMDLKCFTGSIHVFGNDDTVVEGGTGEMEREKSAESPSLPDVDTTPTFPKHILITGANSYIGDSVKEYLECCNEELGSDYYIVTVRDTLGWEPQASDFENVDVVFNVAGIAHRKETDENRHLYYEVNRDLVVKIAKSAKEAGVKQFVLLSSMSVYGVTTGHITKSTEPAPTTAYGMSKLEADEELATLADDSFKIATLRPPMVYGKDCKGNYQTLRTFALKSPIFPNYKNSRSMIYIGNLAEFVKRIIDSEASGLFFPQNSSYVNTAEMVRLVAIDNGKKITEVGVFNPAVKVAAKTIGLVSKVFGNLTYEKVDTVSKYWFERSIALTEGLNTENKSNTQPLVTILTVSFNAEKTIRRTIEAVLNQTYPNIEYIILDGASTDKTVDVANSFKDKFDASSKTLNIISEPDNGMYDALNKGARLAHGELIGQTNADDYYEPDAVETMVNLYNRDHYDIAWGSIRVLKPSGDTIKHAKIGKVWTTNGWCHPAMFSRREILLAYPYACEGMYDDFDFITTVKQAGKKIETINKVISNFSFGGMSTQKSLSEAKKRVDIRYRVYKKHHMNPLYYLQCWGIELAKYVLS